MKSYSNPESFLRRHGLNITAPRKMVLLSFLESTTALTQGDILKNSCFQCDRVTIYRTLELFVQCKIIHVIPSVDSVIRYALLDDAIGNALPYNHLHLICDVCSRTFCLNYLQPPKMDAPAGFLITGQEVILNGVCSQCKPLAGDNRDSNHHKNKTKNYASKKL